MQKCAEFGCRRVKGSKALAVLLWTPPPSLRKVEKGEGGRRKNFVYNRAGFEAQINLGEFFVSFFRFPKEFL